MPEETYAVLLTKLELVASECATAAVADSAPSGSPGQPLLSARDKFIAARESESPDQVSLAEVRELIEGLFNEEIEEHWKVHWETNFAQNRLGRAVLAGDREAQRTRFLVALDSLATDEEDSGG